MAEDTGLPSPAALRGMVDDLRDAMKNMRSTQAKVIEIRGTARSDDRMIKAVVGPRGQLVELDIDPRVYRTPNSKALAATIVATVRAATDDAMRQTEELINESMPADMRPTAVGGVNVRRLMRTHDADLTLDAEEDEDDG